MAHELSAFLQILHIQGCGRVLFSEIKVCVNDKRGISAEKPAQCIICPCLVRHFVNGKVDIFFPFFQVAQVYFTVIVKRGIDNFDITVSR